MVNNIRRNALRLLRPTVIRSEEANWRVNRARFQMRMFLSRNGYSMAMLMWSMLLLACSPIVYGQAPYKILMSWEISPPPLAILYYAGEKLDAYSEKAYIGVTAPIPETARLEWSSSGESGAPRQSATLHVRKNVPSQFTANDSIIFTVRKDGTATVGFRVTLSDVTRRVIDHPLTAEEMRQQELDDELYRAARAKDIGRARKAVNAGADVVQEWRSPRDAGPLDLSLREHWIPGLDFFISIVGVKRIDSPRYSVLAIPIARSDNKLLRKLLDAGADPNFKNALCALQKTPGLLTECRGTALPVIFAAIFYEQQDNVETLLKNGASVDFYVTKDEHLLEWMKSHSSYKMQKTVRMAYQSESKKKAN